MKRPRLRYVLAAFGVSIALGEAWWLGAAPRTRVPLYLYDDGTYLRRAFSDLLSDREIARSVGYDEATRERDRTSLARLSEAYERIMREARAKERAGAAAEAVRRDRREALAAWRGPADRVRRSLPTLTPTQEGRLVGEVARRVGVWCLSAPEAGMRIGLDASGRARIDAARASVLARCKAEERASRHDQMVLEGDPPGAIAAVEEMDRLASDPDPDERTRRRLRELEELSVRPVPWLPRRWLAAHREALQERRKAAYLRQAEEGVLDSLTSEQRARWDALRRG